jgi:hypothetical protein
VHVPLRTKSVTLDVTLAAPEMEGAVAARVSFTVSWNVRLAVVAAASCTWKVMLSTPNWLVVGVICPTQFGAVPLQETAPDAGTSEVVLEE